MIMGNISILKITYHSGLIYDIKQKRIWNNLEALDKQIRRSLILDS